MGNLFGLALTETDLSLEAQLSIHLKANHYPPVPQSMVEPCVKAIEAYWEGDTEVLIDLPFDGLNTNGEPFQITWRGMAKAPAWAILEQHHLEPWTADYDFDAEDYLE